MGKGNIMTHSGHAQFAQETMKQVSEKFQTGDTDQHWLKMEFQALENVDRKGGIQHKITDNPTTDDGIKQEELAKKY